MESKIGQKFNRLTIISEIDNGYVECVCDCGNHKKVRIGNLRSNQVKSCGCLLKECLIKRNETHGLNGHPLHKLWFKIKERCLNPNVKSYRNYGGRGIKICDRWLVFENFYNDMISGYEKGLEIDRIDNEGNYEPSNCRWVTHRQNTQNTRKTKLSLDIVKEIRESGLPTSYFVKKYNTSRSVVNNAKRGKTWANLPSVSCKSGEPLS